MDSSLLPRRENRRRDRTYGKDSGVDENIDPENWEMILRFDMHVNHRTWKLELFDICAKEWM